MDYKKIIADFSQRKAGEFIISDMSGKVVYRNNVEKFTTEQWYFWCSINLDMAGFSGDVSWEISDAATDSYYSVRSVAGFWENTGYILHHIYNVSDFMGLLRDVSDYLRDWRLISAFQASLLEMMTGGCQQCLPVLMKNLELDAVVLYIGREKYTERFLMRKGDAQPEEAHRHPENEFDTPRSAAAQLPELEGKNFICFMNEKAADNTKFALYMSKEGEETDDSYQVYYEMLRLFLENTLLREKIIYESEHDRLTGLYNKGKYLSMMQDFFPGCRSIAIYNMDLNYLKRTNDNLGHEAGDALLVKAARSLQGVERENLCGFRMGGDEYMLIGWDLSEEEANGIKEEWEEVLEQINAMPAEDDPFPDLECVVACGLAYGSGDYDLKELLKLADERMYKNKVAIKLSRGEDPNSRL